MTKELCGRLKDARVRSVRRLTGGYLHHGTPVFSPDSRMLCFKLGRGPDSHWLLSDRKGRPIRVLPGPVIGGASIAGDRSVAYGRQVGSTAEIWLLPAMAAQPHRLLGGDGRLYRDPAFSPDGRLLCYAADDGPSASESPLRLWVVELQQLAPSLLVPEPPAIPGASGPVRAGRPTWSADSAYVFFDVAQGEASAVAVVDVQSRQTQLLTGSGFRRSAAIAPGLLCVEQNEAGGSCGLALLQYRASRGAPPPAEAGAGTEPAPGAAGSFRVRSTAITGVPTDAHDPAVAVGKKGVVHLVFCALGRIKGGEPQRHDIHAGQLARPLSAYARRLESTFATAPTATDEDAGDLALLRDKAADAAAGLAVPGKAKRSRRRKAADEPAAAAASDSSRPNDSLSAGDEAPADAERGV